MRLKKITYDFEDGDDGPRPGDVLKTVRGRAWLVVHSRRVRSRVHPSRWSLSVQSVEEAPGDARVLSLRWAPRAPKA